MSRFGTAWIWSAAAAVVAAGSAACLLALDRAFPPPLDAAQVVSVEVVDRDGSLLRAFATPDGRWRLKPDLDTLEPNFLKMLVAYEDQRFWEHRGVDVLALVRAAGQLVTTGRIVSGGSTITMQLARLGEPREVRTFRAKFRQIARAVQIERRLSKREILERYLTLAPYGGNLEGVRAASLAWFGKEPRRLTLAEAALLVALPQAPEARRPDRNPDFARAARDRVLARMAGADVISGGDGERAMANAVPAARWPIPAHAAHLAQAALRKHPAARLHQVTLKRGVQEGLESVARNAAALLGPKVSVAMIMADARTGEIVGEVGSANFFDDRRSGWIDMTNVVRSPGSTLKPFIYGLAFEDGVVTQETLIEDRPAAFGAYRPRNFDMGYQGDVSVRQALQMSLNIPAVKLLDAVGPARLMARFRRAGVAPVLPSGEAPGLAIGLGGIGLSLRDLVQLYVGLANRLQPMALGNGVTSGPAPLAGGPLLQQAASWQVADILSGLAPPQGARQAGIAYKTGTSYGHRDAWSLGFDGRHVLGVWVGRADGGPVPGISGFHTAAPILFEGFAKSGVGITPFPPAPAGAGRLEAAELPVSLRRFSAPGDLVAVTASEPAPQIVYPPDGAHLDLGTIAGEAMPVVLKLNGGRAPFRWLANGKALPRAERRRTSTWLPDGSGYSTLTVVDAAGRAASVTVFVE
jgi:penicillin-binding protein 1C